MTFIKDGYIHRTIRGKLGRSGPGNPTRNWWLITYPEGKQNKKTITIGPLHIPVQYFGKKIRFKIEIIE